MELRKAGHTFEEIGEHFGVSHQLARTVLRVYSNTNNILIPMPFRPDYLNHPLCPAEKAIARALEVLSFIVGKVIEFLGMVPTLCPPSSSSTSARSDRSDGPFTRQL